MTDKKCTIALSDLIELAGKDSVTQIAKKQRLKKDKFTSGKYADILQRAYPADVKASHFRTARSNAKIIKAEGETYVTIPCFTLRAFVAYLFTVEGSKDWPLVSAYVNNNLPTLVPLMSAKATEPTIAPIHHLIQQPIKEWEPEGGKLGEHIKRVGEYVAMLEKKQELSKTTIEELMKSNKEALAQREKDKKEYDELLRRLENALEKMQSLVGTSTKENEEELQNSMNILKQKIESYKKS